MTEQSEHGPIADRILYEDDRVRIWDMKLDPGERTPVHHHENAYVVILIDGDRVAVQPAPGSKFEADGYHEADVVAGKSVLLPAGGTETAINVGSKPYRDIEIELL